MHTAWLSCMLHLIGITVNSSDHERGNSISEQLLLCTLLKMRKWSECAEGNDVNRGVFTLSYQSSLSLTAELPWLSHALGKPGQTWVSCEPPPCPWCDERLPAVASGRGLISREGCPEFRSWLIPSDANLWKSLVLWRIFLKRPSLTLLQQPEVCLHVTVRHFPPCSPAGRPSDNQCNLLADVQLEVSFHQSNVLGSTREAGKGCLRDLLQVNVPPCCCWAQDTCLPPCVVSPTCWVWNLELWKVYLRTRHSVAKLFSPDLQNSWYVLKIP